jgi:hypothetical protein
VVEVWYPLLSSGARENYHEPSKVGVEIRQLRSENGKKTQNPAGIRMHDLQTTIAFPPIP